MKVKRAILEEGQDPNALDPEGFSALHWAALDDFQDMMRTLVDGGGNVNVRNIRQETPAVWATNKGKLQMLKLLESNGADLMVGLGCASQVTVGSGEGGARGGGS